MNGDQQDDFSDASLQDLFRSEAESQVRVLTEGLLALEQGGQSAQQIAPLMRAAHSLKGAARIVGLEAIERLAHVMEDCFVAAGKNNLVLNAENVDRLLAAVDAIGEIAALPAHSLPAWQQQHAARLSDVQVDLYDMVEAASAATRFGSSAQQEPTLTKIPDKPGAVTQVEAARIAQPLMGSDPQPSPASLARAEATSAAASSKPPQTSASPASGTAEDELTLRVDARRLDRLLALAGEAGATAHALQPQLASLQRLRQKQREALAVLDQMRSALHGQPDAPHLLPELDNLRLRLAPLERLLAERLLELDTLESRTLTLARTLMDEVLDLRMRPFREATHGFARTVRDLAHSLGKQARLVVEGRDTPVDRDLLPKLEAPLNQILRNALDHGIEAPAERVAAGKAQAGTIRIEARHAGGMLTIAIHDDGRGMDPEQIRRTLVARGMSSEPMAAAMSETELHAFLLLPGFSLREQAGEISGRGVGLDVVAETVRQANGSLRIESTPGRGMCVTLTLPLAQSLLRTLVLEAGGELLALPLVNVVRVLQLALTEVHALAERRFFTFEGQHVDLIPLASLLELGSAPEPAEGVLQVVVIGTPNQRFGLVVERVLGQHNLAVRPLPAVLGKARDVAGAALLDDGAPVLILDHADLLHAIAKLAGEGVLESLPAQALQTTTAKRVLVVDDSLTVREMERKLLRSRGYEVEVAVDGMDGWNAVRGGQFDLVITDIDMPRMDGIELVSLIKKDERLRHSPVMIVSYKERPEDRMRGIEAGADYYLTKGSFHDETLLEAVADLIGEASSNRRKAPS